MSLSYLLKVIKVPSLIIQISITDSEEGAEKNILGDLLASTVWFHLRVCQVISCFVTQDFVKHIAWVCCTSFWTCKAAQCGLRFTTNCFKFYFWKVEELPKAKTTCSPQFGDVASYQPGRKCIYQALHIFVSTSTPEKKPAQKQQQRHCAWWAVELLVLVWKHIGSHFAFTMILQTPGSCGIQIVLGCHRDSRTSPDWRVSACLPILGSPSQSMSRSRHYRNIFSFPSVFWSISQILGGQLHDSEYEDGLSFIKYEIGRCWDSTWCAGWRQTWASSRLKIPAIISVCTAVMSTPIQTN